MYYLFALSLSNGLSAELRAHFYDTIAQKHLSCLYFFFASLLLVTVRIVFTLPSSFILSPLATVHLLADTLGTCIVGDLVEYWVIAANGSHCVTVMGTLSVGSVEEFVGVG
jgi:hypothetical protein